MIFQRCSDNCQTVHHSKYTQYHVCHHDNGVDTWLWYYVLLNNHGGYYYYSSPTQVNNFNSVTWQSTTVNPIPEGDLITSQQEAELTTEEANFSPEMEADVTAEEAVESIPSEQESVETPSETEPSTPSEVESPSSPAESDPGSSGGESGSSE